MRRYLPAALLIAFALAACASASAPAPHVASLDTEFTLAPSQRAVLDEGQLEVQFVGVVSDSRCPSDSTCVWAGEVKVQLSIRSGSAPAAQQEVAAEQAVVVGQYAVNVLTVTPMPVSSRKISPEEYRATLKATRV